MEVEVKSRLSHHRAARSREMSLGRNLPLFGRRRWARGRGIQCQCGGSGGQRQRGLQQPSPPQRLPPPRRAPRPRAAGAADQTHPVLPPTSTQALPTQASQSRHQRRPGQQWSHASGCRRGGRAGLRGAMKYAPGRGFGSASAISNAANAGSSQCSGLQTALDGKVGCPDPA